MGFSQPEWSSFCFKRKFRWKLIIPDVSASGIDSLPPMKSARPSLSFKEMEVAHLNENIFFPARPEWKPINLTLYDISLQVDGLPIMNPVFTWINKIYDPANCSDWFPALDNEFKAIVFLELYDGCGNVVEQWVYEHAYPSNAEFGELDMGSSEVVVCDVTLRYDRAYILYPPLQAALGYDTTIQTCTIEPVSFTDSEEPTNESVISHISNSKLKFVKPLAQAVNSRLVPLR